ncbi:hypothetical protein D9758_009571 [Tetrapyrgos nigripes]|uniref:Uncharacterized protein n=1 Tax=Tetrapyrgos nigripes TaxID=182062 RepID=A0A8H5GCZ2_9AGAR|nr:hypothetical protein D9758_009571 [Tetrapyrgos nigripes]
MSTQTQSVSALGPIDPASVQDVDSGSTDEKEKAAPWIVRKLVGSMTGRIMMSSYESLRAAGTSVVCLSPWGDQSPLTLPCIRFRDLAVHTVIAATGGMAAVASPVMGPVSDFVISSFGDTILVELGLHAGFDLTTKAANDLVIEHTIKHAIPIHSKRLETTHVKALLITLKFKSTVTDAALGFFRSSVHADTSLFASVMDYLSVEKGWFSPYLFASSRRPIIPRSMKPDVVFCHGPFLQGKSSSKLTSDYKLGETLMNQSASIISLCKPPPPSEEASETKSHHTLTDLTKSVQSTIENLKIPSLFTRSHTHAPSRTPSPEPQLTPLPQPAVPRRLVVLVVGIKPHRKLWTTSARPGESLINYILLNGCPALVLPAKIGAPLLAWDALTLKQLWDVELPPETPEGAQSTTGKFEGIVKVLYEFFDLCIDWSRVVLDGDGSESEQKDVHIADTEDGKKEIVKDALTLLVAAAIRSRDSKEVKKEIDEDRAGIAMWRIP